MEARAPAMLQVVPVFAKRDPVSAAMYSLQQALGVACGENG
jgi:hypothetical protein